MAADVVMSENNPQKRKFRSNNPKKKNRKKGGGGGGRNFSGGGTGEKRPKMDPRMKKLFRKRARDYNSDNSSSDEDEEEVVEEDIQNEKSKDQDKYKSSYKNKEEEDEELEEEDEEDEELEEDDDEDDDEDAVVVQDGITRFSEGCRAFKMAFTKITSKNVSDDLLGPVLSGHKSLIAEKLAEEESQKASVKGEAKKEKHLIAERGHVIPAANFLDSHQKFLIGVATKGVVKLFNAVNKAQNAQKGLNPSRFKDAKVLGKRKKDAFFSELRKKPSQATGSLMGSASRGAEGDAEPAWAPLRDSYMLTNSKLKNWDKMADKTCDDDMGGTGPHESSSDEDW